MNIAQPTIADQQAFWNDWNTVNREDVRFHVSLDQAHMIASWLDAMNSRNLEILEVGCGTGWLCRELSAYGQVTGTDLSDQVLARAGARLPHVRFVAGDFLTLELGHAFDVAVSLEVLSHVGDQRAFIKRIASTLKPGGHLMLATQNRPALQRNTIAPPAPGQLRNWLDREDLRRLLEDDFVVEQLCSLTPRFNRGLLRILNSKKLGDLASSMGMSFIPNQLRHLQERAWLGWTLMALARKR